MTSAQVKQIQAAVLKTATAGAPPSVVAPTHR
jgi:hypothetical protein